MWLPPLRRQSPSEVLGWAGFGVGWGGVEWSEVKVLSWLIVWSVHTLHALTHSTLHAVNPQNGLDEKII